MLYPLKFKPILKSLVWGGEKIAPYKGISTEQTNIGESWELSGVPGNESVVAEGPLAGRTIAELVSEFKGDLVGRKVYDTTGDQFPLLIKFIDARSDLSVQVHPNDALAAVRHNGSKGKTEMWYVVMADEGAHLLSGLKKEIGPDDYVRLVAEDRITEVLADYPVHEGDVFFLPAGRIHAIGAGTFVAEIQQTSNITYRIYDYGRLGLDGKPRELHTELAKDAIDYSVSEDYRTRYEDIKDAENLLVDCPYFTTSLYDLTGANPVEADTAALDSFVVVMCLGGEGEIIDTEADGSVHKVSVHQGETVLIPATSASLVFQPSGPLKLLAAHIR